VTEASSKRRNIRTDLAIEAREMLMGEVKEEIPGVKSESEDFGEIHVTRVYITTAEAEQQMGKKQGKYITLEVPGLRQKNTALQEMVSRRFALELQSMVELAPDATVLVVGLGNWNVTPDALGPRVVKRSLCNQTYSRIATRCAGRRLSPSGRHCPRCFGNHRS